MNLTQQDKGIYSLKNVKAIDPRFVCPCSSIFMKPYQIECGCRYCSMCIDSAVAQTNCQICKEVIDDHTYKMLDKAFEKELNTFTVECARHNCTWSGTFADFKRHSSEHEDFKCVHCGRQFESEQQVHGHTNELTGDCELQKTRCYYLPFGCDYHNGEEVERRELFEHYKNDVHRHVFNLASYVMGSKDNLRAEEIAASAIEVQDSTKSVPMEVDKSSSPTQSKSTKSKPKADSDSTSSKKSKLDTENISAKFSMIDFQFEGTSTDVKRQATVTDKLVRDFDEFKSSDRNLKNEVEVLKKTLALYQSTHIQLEERIRNLESSSENGTLIWKITNVSEKINEAKSGRQTSFYSPPFTTCKNGYKMCGRIYLNGDGMGRNTHVSLFFVILRGDYDALLKWPFRQKVTFMLLDQSPSESREHITDAFRPDPNSNSFKRPHSDMNIASGIPLFCSLIKLNSPERDYIKDNTLFIKIVVDCKDLTEV